MSNDEAVPPTPPERPDVEGVGKPLTGSGDKPAKKRQR